MTESEVWEDIVGYKGQYQVSDKGNVRSVDRIDSRGRKRKGALLKLIYDKDGYVIVNLYKNGIGAQKKVHRLVTEAFIPNPNGLPQVNHRDEVKANNNVENLEWCTSKHNNNHGTRLERIRKKVRGVNIETGEVLTFSSTVEAGREGYVSVDKACRGIYNDGRGKLIGDGHLYKGHQWSYEENK